jgi:sec-independent protein translocase protein TatA
MNFGIWELVLILAIVALLFGTKKLGSVGADIGKAIKGFRSAMRDDDPTPPGGTKITNGEGGSADEKKS